MKNEPKKGKASGTRAMLVKNQNVPCLYRHAVNGTYYGVKKHGGKIKMHSLDTQDFATAKRKLADWINDLDKIDTECGDLTVAGLFDRYEKANSGKSNSTAVNIKVVRHFFERAFAPGMDALVARVKPSELAATFAKLEGKRNRTFNEYLRIAIAAFELARRDRIIANNPLADGLIKFKSRKQKVVRNIPTLEEFAKIVDSIRAQRKNPYADRSADFAEFLGAAGVGQAEAKALKWEDVDLGRNRINFIRKKTDAPFSIPIYAWLRPLIDRLRAAAGPNPSGPVFSLKGGIGIALKNAAKRLDLPNITMRNLRSMRIVAMLDSKVDFKQVSVWQGHQDGGKLIADTYSDVVRTNASAYEAEQLARAEGKIVDFKKVA